LAEIVVSSKRDRILMTSPIHRIVAKLAESQLLDRFVDHLPFEVRNALAYFAIEQKPTAVRRDSVVEGDVVGGIGVLLGDIEDGGSVGGVNLMKGGVRGGTLRGCNVGVAIVVVADPDVAPRPRRIVFQSRGKRFSRLQSRVALSGPDPSHSP
jgi:hypothetical protein